MTRPGRLLVSLCVTAVALSGKSLKLTGCGTGVARIALEGGMGPDQRKPVLVGLNLLQRNVPTFDGVTLFTAGTKLSAVNIRMAVGTFCGDIREHGLEVALRTLHTFMHPAQRIPGGVVIKLRDCAYGFPSGLRVAVLAWDGQAAVRTARCLPGLPVGNGERHQHERRCQCSKESFHYVPHPDRRSQQCAG